MEAKTICAFFVSYCLMDMVMGRLLYKSEMNPWSGYFHHTLYTFMVTNLVQRNLGSPFVIFGLLEAPTLLLSVAQIHKPLRNDILFGAVFFSTRLAFHVYLTIHMAFFAFPRTLSFMYSASVLPLHVMWFNGWLKQQSRLRKAKAAKAAAQASPSAKVTASTHITFKSSATSSSLLTSIHERGQQFRKALASKMQMRLLLKGKSDEKHLRPQRPRSMSFSSASSSSSASSASSMSQALKTGHRISSDSDFIPGSLIMA
jgi:hypothetical protein